MRTMLTSPEDIVRDVSEEYDDETVFIENNGEIVQSGRIESMWSTASGLTMTMPEEMRQRCDPHQYTEEDT